MYSPRLYDVSTLSSSLPEDVMKSRWKILDFFLYIEYYFPFGKFIIIMLFVNPYIDRISSIFDKSAILFILLLLNLSLITNYKMKKLFRVGFLSLSLITAFFLLFTSTNATTPWIVSIEVIPSLSQCLYGTSIYLGQHTGQYTAFALTWTFSPTTFSCTDFEWLEAWSLTLKSADLSNGLQIIPKENIFLKVDTNQVIQWDCSTGTNTTTLTSIWTVAGVVLSKSSASWEICKIAANNVQISIVVPASQAIGSYSWVLILNSPRSN